MPPKILKSAAEIVTDAIKAVGAKKKASEALGKVEGKTLMVTESDRTKVGQGYLGGPGFSSLQLTDPAYRDVGAVWGVAAPGKATTILNASRRVPEGQHVFTTMVGSPTQHRSNQQVFNKLLDEFRASAREGNLSEELQGRINDSLRSAINKEGNPIFAPNVDIMSPKFRKQANTFERRAVAADLIAGEGLGGKKGQIIDFEKVMRRTTDPMLLDVKTGSMGPRLFTLSGETIQRPDLHPAFPSILTGEDLGVAFNPVPIELMFRDYVRNLMETKGRKPGYMDLTRGHGPKQFISEDLLTEMQKAGYAKGGSINLEAEYRMGKGGLLKKAVKAIGEAVEPVLPTAERQANLERFLEGSATKQRLYHGTNKDISTFESGRPVQWLAENPELANQFVTGGRRKMGNKPSKGSVVYPVHAKVKNPLDLTDATPQKAISTVDFLKQAGVDTSPENLRRLAEWDYELTKAYGGGSHLEDPVGSRIERMQYPEPLWSLLDRHMVIKALEDQGYDSVKLTEKFGSKEPYGESQTIGVFNPANIKSATGNVGTYDVGATDITKANGGAVMMKRGGKARGETLASMDTGKVETRKAPGAEKAERILSGAVELLPGVAAGKSAIEGEYQKALIEAGLDVAGGPLAKGLGAAIPALAGIFIGPKSKLWNADKVEEWNRLINAGVDEKEAYQKTGTFMGADGNLRQEISDQSMKMRSPEDLARLMDEKSRQAQAIKASMGYGSKQRDLFPKELTEARKRERPRLESLEVDIKALERDPEALGVPARLAVDHPKLFEAYPELGDVMVRQNVDLGPGVYGSVSLGVEPKISLADPRFLDKEFAAPEDTMIHELQHLVQMAEGFEGGTSAQDAINMVGRARVRGLMDQGMPKNEAVDQAREEFKGRAGELYNRMAGEAEARAVEARRPMSSEELLQNFPPEQQYRDFYPYEEQLMQRDYPPVLLYAKGGEVKMGKGGVIKSLAKAIAKELPEAKASQRTQIPGTEPTYRKAYDILEREMPGGRTLDYGAGLGHGSRLMGAESFEPFPREGFKPDFIRPEDIPTEEFDRLVNLNVLNVIPREMRDATVENIGRVMRPGGMGIVTTRGRDVLNAAGEAGPEPMSKITSIGTYQKGFLPEELRQYLEYILGRDYNVSKLGLGPAGAVVRKKGKAEGGEIKRADGGAIGKNVGRGMAGLTRSRQPLDPKEIQAMMLDVPAGVGIPFAEAGAEYLRGNIEDAKTSAAIDAALTAVPVAGALAKPAYRAVKKGVQKAGKTVKEAIQPTAPQDEALRIAQKNAAKPVSEGGLGLPPDNTPMDRARAMGRDVPAYHATNVKDIYAFDPELASSSSRFGPASYFSGGDKKTLDVFAKEDGVVYPVLLPKQSIKTDSSLTKKQINDIFSSIKTKRFDNGYDASQDQKRIYDEAISNPENALDAIIGRSHFFDKKEYLSGLKKAGIDVLGRNVYGHPEYAVINPSSVRSRFAAFDPARIDENDLLAGFAALGITAPMLTSEEPEYRSGGAVMKSGGKVKSAADMFHAKGHQALMDFDNKTKKRKG